MRTLKPVLIPLFLFSFTQRISSPISRIPDDRDIRDYGPSLIRDSQRQINSTCVQTAAGGAVVSELLLCKTLRPMPNVQGSDNAAH